MDFCSALIGGVFVFVMLSVVHGRRMFMKPPHHEASATLDSAAGLLILSVGVISLWCMNRFKAESLYLVSSDLTKLLAGVVGAMYLKQGYDKHDQDWMQKQKQKLNLASAGNDVEHAQETKK